MTKELKKLTFPLSKNRNQTEQTIETERAIVIVGANGTGKTRLGSWIEFNSKLADKVHRVAAQKSLSIPPTIPIEPIERAWERFYYGLDSQQDPNWAVHRQHHKKKHRWKQHPATHLLSDFQQLLTYLFSEDNESTRKYKETARSTIRRIEPPISKLDKTKDIWARLLPDRELVIRGSGSIETKIRGGDACYEASEMSDGERVIFYLIGQCLAAPDDGVLVIDEPEMHLHRSIQRKLWNAIEKERPDCLFVYLTHDLDFAATRIDSTKICLNGFDGSQFDWYEVPKKEGIPESVLLEVIGSRSPVLFVEGTDGSHDIQIYQHVYPDFTVKPVGSYSNVVEAVKVFNSLNSFHRVKAFGIIDRDYRDDQHLKKYEKYGVYATPAAEVENLLLHESITKIMADKLHMRNSDEIVNEIQSWVISQFDKFKKQYALEATIYSINIKLNGSGAKPKSIDQLDKNMAKLKLEADARHIYNEKLKHAEEIIRTGDYSEVLRIFKHKALLSQVGKFFDIRPASYAQKLNDIILLGDKNIVACLKLMMPSFEGHVGCGDQRESHRSRRSPHYQKR